MTPADLRCAREAIGLSGEALAGLLGVQLRTVRRWEGGHSPIPVGAATQVADLVGQTEGFIAAVVEELSDEDGQEVQVVVVYRTDDEYRREHPGLAWPAAWHRAAMGRVAARVEGVRLEYLPDVDRIGDGAGPSR